MTDTTSLIPRILRDIDNGVLALDLHGRIIYMNPQCARMLGRPDDLTGSSYAQTFFSDPQARENDAFHQFILDAVYQKDETHRGTVPFVDALGSRRSIRITSSFLRGETGEENAGIVLVLSDVTEAHTLRKRRHESSIIFAGVTGCLTVYLFILGLLSFLGIRPSAPVLTQLINALACCSAFAAYKLTDLSREDLGLVLTNPKQTLSSAAVLSGAIILGLMAVKLVLLRVSPDFFAPNTPFWNWNIGLYAWLSYGPTCILQEFIARSITYGSIRRMYTGKHAVLIATVLSALIFGGLHIAHSFLHMLAAAALLGSLSAMYEKHRNIWGVTIIHFVLGQASECLGFLG